MPETLALLCIIAAIGLLLLLSAIDFKTFLLPNIYVAPFALLGLTFHWLTDFYYLNMQNVIIGGLAGFAILYSIRAAGNKYYKQDSLGLGDVKLLGAGGLWLGLEGVMLAMTIGAFFGLLHGLAYAVYLKLTTQKSFSLTRLTIPAGPGFAAGIIVIGGWMYHGFILSQIYDLIP
jgi:leader peptidase (prepilin peptidase)/N-methyltransferase